MIRLYCLSAILVLFTLLNVSNVEGRSKNITAGSAATSVIAAGSTEDSLVGAWELTNLDIPAIRTQIAAASSQSVRDSLLAIITAFQNRLSGFSINIGRDFSYSSTLHGISRSGSWRLDNHALVTHITSQETVGDQEWPIVYIQNQSLLLKCTVGTDVLYATYSRR